MIRTHIILSGPAAEAIMKIVQANREVGACMRQASLEVDMPPIYPLPRLLQQELLVWRLPRRGVATVLK